MVLAARFTLESVTAEDFEQLLALRLRAMQPSLEALGRFDPVRARERFANTFAPQLTLHVVVQGRRVGCLTLRPASGALHLDHLYLEPAEQGRGLGGALLRWAKAVADARQWPLHLLALKRSAANGFYQRHGLTAVGEGEWDIEYRREPSTRPLDVVAAWWSGLQARNWAGVRDLLDERAVAHWWSSGERFDGAEAIVNVNAVFPEGWSIHPLAMSMVDDGRVLAFLRVDHGEAHFLATSLAAVEDGRIVAFDESWATFEAPPAWRRDGRLAGCTRFDAMTTGEVRA